MGNRSSGSRNPNSQTNRIIYRPCSAPEGEEFSHWKLVKSTIIGYDYEFVSVHKKTADNAEEFKQENNSRPRTNVQDIHDSNEPSSDLFDMELSEDEEDDEDSSDGEEGTRPEGVDIRRTGNGSGRNTFSNSKKPIASIVYNRRQLTEGYSYAV